MKDVAFTIVLPALLVCGGTAMTLVGAYALGGSGAVMLVGGLLIVAYGLLAREEALRE